MQLTKLKTLVEPSTNGMCKVTALAWSPNNERLAVVTVDRVVHLFNEIGERKEKFSTKPGTKGGPKNYIVRNVLFSPDSTKLAVAQSDNIVFVYKLGLEWGSRITICNKFLQSTPVTCLTWPMAHQNELVFGLADGKVKVGQLRSNSPATLYSTDSYVVSCCSSPSGEAILTGHLDGSIYRFQFEGEGGGGSAYSKFTHFSCPPYALAWGASVVASGLNQKVVFYDETGSEVRTFDYSMDEDVKEFTVAEFNPSGQSVVLGNFDQFFVFGFDSKVESWEDIGAKKIPNYYTVTSLGWKQDGSRLAVGTLCGCVDLYDACIKRRRYNGAFEFTYVSPSQVIVKRISNGQRIVLKSMFGCEITKINVYGNDRYLIANTPETILCGDLQTCKLSEVPWSSNGNEKFVFDNPHVCMIYSSGELSLIEYGRNEFLGSCRTEHMRPTLVSVRINERPPKRLPGDVDTYHPNNTTITTTVVPTLGVTPVTRKDMDVHLEDGKMPDNKKIAYLLDKMTIRVADLASTFAEATVNHDAKIDWLELNARADLLLFRDKRRQLHLFDVLKQTRKTLLSYCNYAQWVPESDVVVAQNRGNLCIWYNIESPEKVTIIPINGEVEEIERVDGKTEVRVDEGVNTVVYGLDEALIGFGSAVEDGNLEKAMSVLERQCQGLQPGEMRPETEAMWKQLSRVALDHGRLEIAERCLAAIGDVSKTRYLRKVNKTCMQIRKATETTEPQNHWMVRARLSRLRKDFRDAELIYLEQGQTEDAVEMYQLLHQWDEAIRVADQRNYPEADEMKKFYFQYLLSSGQEERAAAIREQEGNYMEAIDLYLNGGRPAKAMHVVNTYRVNYRSETLERIAQALTSSKMHDKAGEFYERMGQSERALESYLKGQAYRSAVELARRDFPAQVVRLEEAWGDWLVQTKNMEAAINHYIEAGVYRKAIEAALGARQWSKAGQLVDSLQSSDDGLACQFYKRIARHYHQAQQFKEAEKYYVLARCEKEAIQMYTDAGQWDTAHKLATRYMSSQEVSTLYTQQAQAMEAKGKFKEAERLLLTVNAVDQAINMYKRARKYDHQLRLVAAYRKDLLDDTLLSLAQQLEFEGNFKEAEDYYVRAKDWQAAANMYIGNDRWDEAIRVAKCNGGMSAVINIAFSWARQLGGEAGAKLLTKLGLVEQAIKYAMENQLFDEALNLAQTSMPSKVTEVHYAYAMHLEEDEQRYQEAELEYIKANKPKEAIAMYNHHHDWNSAMRVAEQYDPSSIPDILVTQATLAVENKQYADAEALFLNAKKPELALEMYQKLNMWNEALKFAKKHVPHKLHDVKNAYEASVASAASRNAAKEKPENKYSEEPVQASDVDKSHRISSSRRAPLGDGQTVMSTIESAKVWEDSGDFDKALDTYLAISVEDLDESTNPDRDKALMETAWESAVQIASKHCKARYPNVVEDVATRLRRVSRYNAAAELFREIDRNQDAVECYIEAKNWDKAKQVAQIAPAFQGLVDKKYREHLRNEKNPSELIKMGDYDAALALYAEQGDWERLFRVVESDANDLGPKYAGEYASRLLKDKKVGQVEAGKIDTALNLFAKYGTPTNSYHFSLFCRLAQEVLGRSQADTILDHHQQHDDDGDNEDEQVDYIVTLRNLREVLFCFVKEPRNVSRSESKSGEADSKVSTIERLLLVVHLFLMNFICLEHDAQETSANILVTLLRFTGDIPCDKAFYLAGEACKRIGWMDKAFVILNRYLDLTDAIEDGDAGVVENTDFADTDIPSPDDHPLPADHYLGPEEREEIREWILGSAMGNDVAQEPISMDWLREVRSEVAQQLEHLVRRYDRGALPIEEHLMDVRERYGIK